MKKGKGWLRYLIGAVAVLTLGYQGMKAAFVVLYRQVYPVRYQELVLESSSRNNLPAALTYAVIYTESKFRPGAISGDDARGLMQITPDTFQWAQMRSGVIEAMDTEALYDPGTNIAYGTYILSLLLEEFGDLPTALCAYHAGRSRVNEWLADERYSADGLTVSYIPYGNTRWYVNEVQNTIQIYRSLYRTLAVSNEWLQ